MQKSSSDTSSIVSKQGREYLVAPTRLGAGSCWSWIQRRRKSARKRHHQETEGAGQKPPPPPGPAPQFKLSLGCGLAPKHSADCKCLCSNWEGLDQVLFSKFQIFVVHLFALFSLTVHSNNIILIKVVSIYNFDCILMKVFFVGGLGLGGLGFFWSGIFNL